MVKYKVNIKFKDDGKTLNEVIVKALKIELQKQFGMIYINNKYSLLPKKGGKN